MRRFFQIVTFLALASFAAAQTDLSGEVKSPSPSDKAGLPGAIPNKGFDPLLDPPPLPKANASLLGGVVKNMDRIQNKLKVQAFGTKQQTIISFDTRTHFYRDGAFSADANIKAGEKVYVDTMLVGSQLFAKSIRVESAGVSGSTRGQVIDYDVTRDRFTIQDELAAEPIHLTLLPSTVIKGGGQNPSASDLRPGSLVSLIFDPQAGGSGVVRELTILATPGSTFSFSGEITYVDLSINMISLSNAVDSKNYELYFKEVPAASLTQLKTGSSAAITAAFEGDRYVIRTIDFPAVAPAKD